MLRQGFQDSILHPSPCTSGEDFAAFIGKVTVEGSALEVMPESMELDGKTDNINAGGSSRRAFLRHGAVGLHSCNTHATPGRAWPDMGADAFLCD